MRKVKIILLLVPFLIMASSISVKMKEAIKKWDKKAYLSLFEKPEISGVKEVFLLRPIKVNIKQKDDLLRVTILRKPAPFLQTWRIKVRNGKIVEREVLNSLDRISYYTAEDSHCYILTEAKIKVPDLEAKFEDGIVCQWPDSFIFSGKGAFRFRPSSFIERKNLLYLISEEQLEENISFLFLRVQSKSGAQVSFKIGGEIKLPENVKEIFEKYASKVGLHYSPLYETRVFRAVPEGGAYMVLGGKREFQYTFNPKSEKEIFITDLKTGRYLSFYTPANRVILIMVQQGPESVTITGSFDPDNNWIEAKAEYTFKKPENREIYFSISPKIQITGIYDEFGSELVFQKNGPMNYAIYPNYPLRKLIIHYRGDVGKVDSYSNFLGGYFFPTLWYPYFGNYMHFKLHIEKKGGKRLLFPGKQEGNFYVSEVPVSYIPLLEGNFYGRTTREGLEIYWESRDIRAIRDTFDAFKKASEIFGKPSWTIKIGIRRAAFYFGSSTTGMINLEILKLPDRPLLAPVPLKCGRRSIIMHEMLHQWIGGITKPYSLNDYWVSEGLTSLLTGMLICSRNFESKYRKAFIDMPIVPPLALGGRIGYFNNSVKDIFDHLHYRAALVINMARLVMGNKEFLKAVREFVNKYKFKEFRWGNFTSFIEKKMGKPGFFYPWVNTYFIPEFSYIYKNGKLIIEEKTPLIIEGKEHHFQLPVPVRVSGKNEILWIINGKGELKVPYGRIKIISNGLPARIYKK
ncbi:MAG: hypothetical protein J7L62_01545 [Candidatus Aminicenantes bacterium]|nr:hypothetical protein [Candidatus Aminicenantes bacterium]